MADKKKDVGRPKKTGERKESRTVSVTPTTENKARKYFKTLGEAVEFAVTIKENEKKSKSL